VAVKRHCAPVDLDFFVAFDNDAVVVPRLRTCALVAYARNGSPHARLHGRHFATRRAAMDEIVDWLGFYNSRRLHSTLDYVSPMTFEQNWFAAQQGAGV
jgi:transposase InsO family protein